MRYTTSNTVFKDCLLFCALITGSVSINLSAYECTYYIQLQTHIEVFYVHVSIICEYMHWPKGPWMQPLLKPSSIVNKPEHASMKSQASNINNG